MWVTCRLASQQCYVQCSRDAVQW